MKRILIILFLSQSLFYAQNTGSIKGSVLDKNTKDPLPGVNVVIEGTYYGAASDFNGNYSINNVTSGVYTVKATLIGFKQILFTGIEVQENKTTLLNIDMEETVLTMEQDIIVVGEMRDSKTIATVLEATDSGHKVFSTLHTSNAVDSIHRIIAEFPPAEQERVRMRLADTLKVIISQKLVPTKTGKLMMCKEILSMDSSVKSAIRNKNIGEIYQMINEGKRQGMITMEQDLYNNYISGKISKETAINYANNNKRINQLIDILIFSVCYHFTLPIKALLQDQY